MNFSWTVTDGRERRAVDVGKWCSFVVPTSRSYRDVQAFLPEQRELMVKPLQTVIIPTGLFFAIPQASAMLICSRNNCLANYILKHFHRFPLVFNECHFEIQAGSFA